MLRSPGCLSRIPDPNFFPFPDPNFFHPRSRIRIKDFKFLTQKLFLSPWKYNSGCSSRIRILIFYPSRILDQGAKKGTGSQIRKTGGHHRKKSQDISFFIFFHCYEFDTDQGEGKIKKLEKISCLHLHSWTVLRIRDVYPGSEFFPSRIQDQKDSRIPLPLPHPHQRI